MNLRLTHAVKDRAVQNFQVNGPELCRRPSLNRLLDDYTQGDYTLTINER
jgi:hypothetical protein